MQPIFSQVFGLLDQRRIELSDLKGLVVYCDAALVGMWKTDIWYQSDEKGVALKKAAL